MERKLTKLEHSHVEVLVTIDEKTWLDAQKKAFDKQAANITVDGFRKGKAPEHLLKQRVNQMKVFDDAVNALLPVIYREILEQDQVRPYAQPTVDVTKLTEKELEVKFVLVTAPEVELGAYKGLKIGHGSTEVTDEDLEKAVEQVLSNNGYLLVKDGEAKEGDTVVMDFAGSVDGKLFDGGSAQNYELELGSHQFIPGFEKQLVGHKAGEHVDINVKFPENYVEELKGKDAVFACDIHEVKEKKLPELNDEFVKELKIKDVETVEQFKANKRKELEVQKQAEEKRTYIGKVIDEVVKNSKIDVPEEIVNSQIKGRKDDLEKRISQSGLTLEQYLQVIGQSEEQFTEQLRKDSQRDIERFVVLEEIGKQEKVEVSEQEIEFEYAKLAEQYGMKVEDVKKALANQINEFKNELVNRKIEEVLLANNQ